MKHYYKHHPKQYQPRRSDYTSEELIQLAAAFRAKNSFLADEFRQLTPYEFVRGIFPEGTFEIFNDREGDDPDRRKANGILSVLEDKTQPGRKYNRILFDDLAALDEVAGKEFVIMSPVTYSGRRRVEKNAYKIYGLTIDLDEVDIQCIWDLIYQAAGKIIPYPTFLVNSGTGLHVYYVFDTPVAAFPKYYPSFTRLKAALTNLVWNPYTSNLTKKQIQGIFQGYRLPGTQTKISDDCIVTAFEVGKKVTVNYLNTFVDDDNKADFDDNHYLDMDQIKKILRGEVYAEKEKVEKLRDWYERRIVKNIPVGHYKLTEVEKKRRRAWYESWKKRIKAHAFDGNRYFCICVLFVYAQKADIPIDEVTNDALNFVYYLDSLTQRKGNRFTEADIFAAQKYYDRAFIKMGRSRILQMTGIDIGKTKRNGQPQKWHLEDIRERKAKMKQRGQRFKNSEGRPKGSGTKEQIIRDWRDAHPFGKKIECYRETGLSRSTILKWWHGGGKEDG